MSVVARPTGRDLAVAGAFVVAVVVECVALGLPPAAVAVATVPPAALAVRRTSPLLVPVVVLGAVVVAARLDLEAVFEEPLTEVLAWIVGAYSAGATASMRTALAGWGLWAGVSFVYLVAFGEDAADLSFQLLLVTSAWLAGVLVRDQRRRAEAARARADEALAREVRAVTDERARIGRELHDVVAHAVGIMVVQAAAAERVMDTDPAAARAAMGTVQDTGRGAIAELSRMLDLLSGTADVDRAPMPSLARLTDLLAETRAAGVAVSLSVDGPVDDVPAAVDLSAYRVVQEALTNVLKHAPGASAQVVLRRTADALEILVEDDGAGVASGGHRPADGTGRGLVGVRERVSVFGGRCDVGPTTGGGFRVHVVLPVQDLAGAASR